jgi:hypothetical protein
MGTEWVGYTFINKKNQTMKKKYRFNFDKKKNKSAELSGTSIVVSEENNYSFYQIRSKSQERGVDGWFSGVEDSTKAWREEAATGDI